MSKGTKKLDKALLVALAAVHPVENDRQDQETGAPYASTGAILAEAGRVLVIAGLTVHPLGYEVARFAGRDCQVRVLQLVHSRSGQSRIYRSSRYAADVTKPPALAAGATAKGSLRCILQDLLLITGEEPEPEGDSEAIEKQRDEACARKFRKTFTEADQEYLDELLDEAALSDPDVAERALAEIEKGVPRAAVLAKLRQFYPGANQDTMIRGEAQRKSAGLKDLEAAGSSPAAPKDTAQEAGSAAPPPAVPLPADLGDPTEMEEALGEGLPEIEQPLADTCGGSPGALLEAPVKCRGEVVDVVTVNGSECQGGSAGEEGATTPVDPPASELPEPEEQKRATISGEFVSDVGF